MADIAGMERVIQRMISLEEIRQDKLRQMREGVRTLLAGRRESRRRLALTLAEQRREGRRRLRARTWDYVRDRCQERTAVRRIWLACAGRRRPA